MNQTPTYDSIQTRYLDAILEATPKHYMQAATWYHDAQSLAIQFASRYEITLDAAACVIASFSPRTRWSQNILNAEMFLNNESVPALGNNIRMARNSLFETFDALKGRKTNAFARNIAGDLNVVTIDVWMIRAAGYNRADANKSMYELMSSVIVDMAAELEIAPAQLQALIWIMVRGNNA